MRFRGQKYGTYGSKPWEFWVKSMGFLSRKSRVFGQRTTDYRQRSGGSRLITHCSQLIPDLIAKIMRKVRKTRKLFLLCKK